MDNLIAEDLLLVLLDPESGKLRHTTYLDAGLGGALLMELAMAGAVDVEKGTGLWARARVRPVAGTAAMPDPVLHEAMLEVSAKERTAQDLVGRLGKRRRDLLLGRLERRGVLRCHTDSLLGIFPRSRWTALDARRAGESRRRATEALVLGVLPDQRTAALVALLSSLGLAAKVVEHDGLSTGEVKQRAKLIADGNWAAKAVKDAVAAAQAAVAASATIAVTATTTG